MSLIWGVACVFVCLFACLDDCVLAFVGLLGGSGRFWVAVFGR